MGKYDPLRDYLCRQKARELELTFVEIERRLGYLLPNSQRSELVVRRCGYRQVSRDPGRAARRVAGRGL